jgi:hypothetical protein
MAMSGAALMQPKTREVRVPFVRRCRLEFEDGRTGTAFLVNINVNGAYVARDDLRPAPGAPRNEAAEADLPRLGQRLRCVFQLPGYDRDVTVGAAVSWVNPRQQHPVHGLPPGFGLSFHTLEPGDREAITSLVEDYLDRHPSARG